MRRLFCYTLSARAIGATVSAGALHAQGWGFESLIAHHRFGNGPRKGTVFCLGPFHGIRTRKGAELRKREAFSSAAREGRRPEARAGGVSRTRHPSSPTTDLIGSQLWGPFFFWAQRRGIRTRQHVRHKGRGQKMAKMSTATSFVTAFSRSQRANLTSKQRLTVQMSMFSDSKTGHMRSNSSNCV